jgi:hypothetical protein
MQPIDLDFIKQDPSILNKKFIYDGAEYNSFMCYLIRQRWFSKERFKYCLENDVDLEIYFCSGSGFKILHYLAEKPNLFDDDILELYVKKKINFNLYTEKGSFLSNVFIKLCCNNRDFTKKTLNILLGGGADLNLINEYGFSAFHYLCKYHPAETFFHAFYKGGYERDIMIYPENSSKRYRKKCSEMIIKSKKYKDMKHPKEKYLKEKEKYIYFHMQILFKRKYICINH